MKLRDNVRSMKPYVPGKPVDEVKRELGLERVVKLASNENPFGPSPKAIAAVRASAGEMHVYPDGAAYQLRQALSARFDVSADQIMLGNGSDELIHLLGLVFLSDPEDEVVVGFPSFVRYDAAAHLAPSRLVAVPLDAEYRHDLTAMVAACSERTRLVFVANPNNPTGTIVKRPEIEAMRRDLPESATLVLDEAYFEFAEGEPGFPNSLDFVREGADVVGLRTFSKTYGLAGIRVGFGFGPAAVVDTIERAREPFNVNSLAQAAALAALGDDEHLRNTVEHNRQGLARVNQALRDFGATPVESFANFVFADIHRPAGELFQALLSKGVIIRSGEGLGAPTCVRISIGTDQEIDFLIAKMDELRAEGF